jgi:hypothetical protein
MIAERHNQAHHNHQRNQAGNAGELNPAHIPAMP